MSIQLVTYDRRIRALCTPQRVYFAEDPEAADADPSTRFVLAMCLYAGEILNRNRPGPYREDHARAYAREMLIPAGLGERRRLDIDATAAALGVPARELRLALREARTETTRPLLEPRRRP